jgi:hypothetical protein
VVYTNIIWRAMTVFLTHCVHWSSERERELERESSREKEKRVKKGGVEIIIHNELNSKIKS